jgi:hypothetical protein
MRLIPLRVSKSFYPLAGDNYKHNLLLFFERIKVFMFVIRDGGNGLVLS